jgi:FtsH-binding integral membrane protein
VGIKQLFITGLMMVTFFSMCFVYAQTHAFDMSAYCIGFLVSSIGITLAYIANCFVYVSEKDFQIKTRKEKV